MPKRKNSRNSENPQPEAESVEAILLIVGVYNVDLLAEVEGLLRTLTRMQQQVERLRPPAPESSKSVTPAEMREAVKLLAGNVRTLVAKIETLRDTVPEVESAVTRLQAAIGMDDTNE